MMLALLFLAQAAAPAPAPATPPPAPPTWKLTDRTNPGGVRSVAATVFAFDGVSRFVVKCDVAQEPIVSLQFLQPAALGQAAKPVALRFDNGFANSHEWQIASIGAYISDPDAVTRLTSLLVKAKTVSVETTNVSNFAVQASFPGPVGDSVVRQVLGACGYTLGVVPPPPEAKAAK